MKITPPKPEKNISLPLFFDLVGPFVFFLLLLMLLFYFMQSKHPNDTSLLPNTLAEKLAPKISLPLFGNENYLLNSDQFKGRVTLINFWGSWCPSCREEHPLLMTIAQDQRFDLIGINYKDNKENAQRFLNNFGNPFKLIGFDVSGYTAINWGVYGPPETFLLNKENIIIAKHVGPLTWQIYQKKILPKIEKAIMTEEILKNKRLIYKDNLSSSQY
ncbi:disulfide oxidoreductase [Bartonella henselae]|uniref:Thiol: disulfide interchange protein n=1 Tax=Bartonella henselae TaxID=38323 RepID=X5M2Z4_BARHN|nr:DsbE family thiol:disulfide interchange protein [Bartonella henselae]MDM9996441.1 DsbE family thiol:disulfide interchange protein [Bartonella henselae]OLL47592.1 disulfide oxidoreductase [Bartonella henselae]OLL50168.1 disulfide oxidoreductase [Bartonella henselae]OLL50639.1 disulfide oxidoreductase [Bartonella henselae]OLL56373.1 disulfide oxidoreductase [Bartonella henselae]